MAKIFISYRRYDSAGHAGRLFDRLHQQFGRDQVFMDVAGIEPGVDFAEVIDQAIGSCDVVLVVIGKQWSAAVDAAGRRRLEDPADFVRLETATALKRKVRVVPVLVEGASLPRESDLPEDLRSLGRRQAFELRDTRWEADITALAEALSRVVPKATGAGGGLPRVGAKRWLIAAGLIVPAAVAAVILLRQPERQVDSSRPPADPPRLSVPSSTQPAPAPPPEPAKPAVEEKPVEEKPSGSKAQARIAVVGVWRGTAHDSSGRAFRVELEVIPACALHKKCGTISVLHVPCHGRISLKGIANGEHEFNVNSFDSRSDPQQCHPGPGEFFKLLANGRLSYRSTWGARGILDNTGIVPDTRI